MPESDRRENHGKVPGYHYINPAFYSDAIVKVDNEILRSMFRWGVEPRLLLASRHFRRIHHADPSGFGEDNQSRPVVVLFRAAHAASTIRFTNLQTRKAEAAFRRPPNSSYSGRRAMHVD